MSRPRQPPPAPERFPHRRGPAPAPPAAPVPRTEPGPKAITGFTTRVEEQPALPAVDPTTGVRQRFYVGVPNVRTRMALGSRIPSPGPNQPGFGYDGFSVATNGHVFAKAELTGTFAAEGRVTVASMTGTLSAVAAGDVLVGSQLHRTTVSAGTNVLVIGGYGPSPTGVSLAGTAPEDQVPLDGAKIARDHNMATLITIGVVGVLSSTCTFVGVKREVAVASIVPWVLSTAGFAAGLKTIIEASRQDSALTKYDPESGAPKGVGIHGKSHVTLTAGSFGSIYSLAHTGSVTSIGGITAGIVGGIAGNVSGGLIASVTGVATAAMTSIMSSNIVSVLEASIEARKGVALVRAPDVKIGDLLPPAPQLPTLRVQSTALALNKMMAGGPTGPMVRLDGVSNDVKISSITGVKIDVEPYTVAVTPLGVTVKYAGDAVVEVTPLAITLKQLATQLVVKLDGVAIESGASTVKVGAAMTKVSSPKILLG